MDWPFSDPENVAVFTLRAIAFDGAPVLYVSHDADDGAWQFLTGREVSVESAAVISLKEAVELDSSLLDLADLPKGWIAHRGAAGEQWQREPHS